MTPQRQSLLVGLAALACAVTICLCVVLRPPSALTIGGACFSVALALASLPSRHVWGGALICALCTGSALGLGRGSLLGLRSDPLLAVAGTGASIHGIVREARGVSWIVDVDAAASDSLTNSTSDSVLLENVRTITLAPGDVIDARVSIAAPSAAPGPNSVSALDRVGVDVIAKASDVQIIRHTWTTGRVLSNVRSAITAANARVLAAPYAPLMSGIVFGIHQTLPPEVVAPLQESGLYHIVAVSGLKVVIALGLLRSVARRFEWSRRMHLAITLGFVVFYVSISGGGAAAVRSSVLALIAFVIQRDGRRVVPLVLLSVMAAAFLLAEPKEASDVGFQLSYLGTAGILLWAEPIARKLPGPAWLREPFAVTVAAQLATTPVMASAFGIVSLIGPPVNAMVLPLIPVLMVVGAVTSLLAFTLPAIAALTAVPISLLLFVIVALARVATAIPFTWFAVTNWPPGWVFAEFAGVAMSVAVVMRRRLVLAGPRIAQPVVLPRPRVDHRVEAPNLAVAIACGVLVAAVAAFAMTRPDGKFHVTVLSVGAYPAALIQAPDGALAVMDGGNSASKLDGALGRVLLPTTHRLDLVVFSACNLTSVNALSGLQNKYDITTAVVSAPRTVAVTTMLTAYQSTGTSVVDAIGLSWRWHGLTWNSYPLSNDTSAVRISDGRSAVLFMGTAGTDIQDDVVAGRGSALQADLLVAPPGGAVETSLMETVRPRFVAAPSAASSLTKTPWTEDISRTGSDGDLRYADVGGILQPG